MTGRLPLPTEIEDLTADWFSKALTREVTEATVVDRSSGTTGRARVVLRGDAGVPESVFVKLPPFDEQQRALVDQTGMGVAEARFYRDLAGAVAVRVPGAWFAGTDDHDYVMVLEDLVAAGCRFPSPDDDDIANRALDIVEQLAALHAPFWESERFATGGDLEWLSERGSRGGGGGRKFVRLAVETIGDRFGDAFRRLADIYLSRAPDIVQLWREGASTLVHGDSHIGNLFVDVAAGDRTGFLDWAVVCRAPGIRDVVLRLVQLRTGRRSRAHRARFDRSLLRARGPPRRRARPRRGVEPTPAPRGLLVGIGGLDRRHGFEVAVGRGRPPRDPSERPAACAHLESVGLLESRLA